MADFPVLHELFESFQPIVLHPVDEKGIRSAIVIFGFFQGVAISQDARLFSLRNPVVLTHLTSVRHGEADCLDDSLLGNLHTSRRLLCSARLRDFGAIA